MTGPLILEKTLLLEQLSEESTPKQMAFAYATMAVAYHQQWPAVHTELRKNHDERTAVRDWMQVVEQRLGAIERRSTDRRFDRLLLFAAVCLFVGDMAFRLFGR
jgi:hypothetical protein